VNGCCDRRTDQTKPTNKKKNTSILPNNVIHNPHKARIHVRPPSTIPNRKKEKDSPIQSNINSGGLELLFSSQRSHKIALPSTDPATNQPANVGFLIDWLCKNLMKDPRQDMFVLEGTV